MLRATMAYSLAGCMLEPAVDDGVSHWEVAMRSLGTALARVAGEDVGG
jgi:hypothetical protein